MRRTRAPVTSPTSTIPTASANSFSSTCAPDPRYGRAVSDSLYITSTTFRAGKAVVALGTLEAVARKVGRVGLFRPIVDREDGYDSLIDTPPRPLGSNPRRWW